MNQDETAPYGFSLFALITNLFFIPQFEIWNKQGRSPNLAVCPNLPDFTLVVRFSMLNDLFDLTLFLDSTEAYTIMH